MSGVVASVTDFDLGRPRGAAESAILRRRCEWFISWQLWINFGKSGRENGCVNNTMQGAVDVLLWMLLW